MFLKFYQLNSVRNCIQIPINNYATVGIMSLGKSKKKLGKGGPVSEKTEIPVETDAKKLIKYVCGSNILKEGGEDIKLKPDSEYPEWLWKLNITGPVPLEELDPNTKQYWLRIRKLGMRRNNLLNKLKRF
ncbi:39S ribosomal protein L54, mitochondrial [Daktulosphaira vitifoliae]|uniref:39S ribosomal protein L54, mitochondrial n=1 Tax=Daktulosphaira vitifoliae TaxID=58002 RepID=UPI0021A99701|nr:39S ribosomal protein L54, mitochondrial [Daktulosphaira vitifoliae]